GVAAVVLVLVGRHRLLGLALILHAVHAPTRYRRARLPVLRPAGLGLDDHFFFHADVQRLRESGHGEHGRESKYDEIESAHCWAPLVEMTALLVQQTCHGDLSASHQGFSAISRKRAACKTSFRDDARTV